MGLYFCMTDAEGSYDFVVQLVHVNSEQIVGQGNVSPIEITDRLKTVEVGLMLPALTFGEPGKYEIRVHANGHFIESREFEVNLRGGS